MAWEAGEDAVRLYGGAGSGIMDPVANSLERIDSIDRTSVGYTHASNMLLGSDRYCCAYLKTYRRKLF